MFGPWSGALLNTILANRCRRICIAQSLLFGLADGVIDRLDARCVTRDHLISRNAHVALRYFRKGHVQYSTLHAHTRHPPFNARQINESGTNQSKNSAHNAFKIAIHPGLAPISCEALLDTQIHQCRVRSDRHLIETLTLLTATPLVRRWRQTTRGPGLWMT
jgi:hypothetical protein